MRLATFLSVGQYSFEDIAIKTIFILCTFYYYRKWRKILHLDLSRTLWSKYTIWCIFHRNVLLMGFACDKVRKKTKIRNRYNQVPHLTQDIICESDTTQENITHKRAKRLALFQQVTTRVQWTDMTVWQTPNINDKKDPPKKYRLGKVSKIFLLEGLN